MPPNRVKPIKDNPSEGYEEGFNNNDDAMDVGGVYLQNTTSDDGAVLISRDASDNLVFTDGSGTATLADIANPTLAHEATDSLVHGLAETCYVELTRDGNDAFQTETVWTDSGKTIKVREQSITRDGNGKVSVIVSKQYDAAGDLVQTLTETITRDGNGKYASSAIVES